jgi:hypothetical protein
MASISPICKNVKILYHDKKIIKIQDIKISHLGTFNKEQQSYRNLSSTATRVLQCTCLVAASRKYFSAIHTSPQSSDYTLIKKYNKIFIIYQEIQQGSGYVTNGLLIYGYLLAAAIS